MTITIAPATIAFMFVLSLVLLLVFNEPKDRTIGWFMFYFTFAMIGSIFSTTILSIVR